MNSTLFIIFIILEFTTFIILCQTTDDIPILGQPIKIPDSDNRNETCLIAKFGAQFYVVSDQTSANKSESEDVITIRANATVHKESYCKKNGSTARIILRWDNDDKRRIVTQFFITKKSEKNFVLDKIIIDTINIANLTNFWLRKHYSFPNISLFEVPTKYGYKCSTENFKRNNKAGDKLTVIMKNAHWEVFKEKDTSDQFTQTPVNCYDDVAPSTSQFVVVIIALSCITVVVVVFFIVFRIKKRGTFV